jgi:hypothetical protein
VADDLFAYAAQLGPRKPPQDTHVPFAWQRKYEGGPAITTFADPESGNAGLIQMFEACGAFLTALVATSAPETRAHHVMGLADPEGFAAMGVVEVLVYMCSTVSQQLQLNVPAGTCQSWSTAVASASAARATARPTSLAMIFTE